MKTNQNTKRTGLNHWVVLALLSAWPFLSFLSHNSDDLPIYWVSITGYGLTFIAALFAFVWMGGKLVGSSRHAQIANTLGVGAICLFSYLTLAGLLSGLGISLGTIKIAVWLVISLVVMGLTWRVSSHANASLVLLSIAAALVVLPAARLAIFAFEASRIDAEISSPPVLASAAESTERPNVYWIILDAYPRTDVLKSYFGYRNDEFVSALNARRFFVADRSFSNFASTKLSISTTGNMDYFLPAGERMHPAQWTARLQGFNQTVDRFLAKGYKYVHAGPGGNNDKTRCGGREVLCVTTASSGPLSLNEAEIGLLRLTALYPIVQALFPTLISFDFNDIGNMTTKLSLWPGAPVFAFVHILSPHPPRRYNDDCSRVAAVGHSLVGDDSADTPETFVNDIKCLNPQVISFIDTILAKDPSDPIILIQGDHGYRGDENKLPAPTGPAIDRRLIRFANLNAMRLPKKCMSMGRNDITSVNTFRVIFSCLGDTDLPQIEDQIFSHSKKTVRVLNIERGAN